MTFLGPILAEQCRKGHSCRDEQVYCFPAMSIDAERFYFLGPPKESDCPYVTDYGHCHTCECPERKRIYRLYNF